MNSLDAELNERLAALREQGLHRELRRVDSPQGARLQLAGRTLLNFASNDYLALANEPALKAAAIRAVEQFGAGAGASRLICGSLAPHHELEEALAAFKGTEAALTFATGYAAALGTICTLVGRDDVIVLDKLVHASVVDAARLSGAKLRVFAHNDLNELADILQWADERNSKPQTPNPKPRTLIVTESVFSMDGDHAPLRELVTLKERFGAWLMVDEAHATGLYGAQRRGLAEALGVGDRIEVQMGTLGKALGASGGFICGSRALVDFLVNRARSFIFSTAPVPAAAAAAQAGVEFVRSAAGAERCARLWERVDSLARDLTRSRRREEAECGMRNAECGMEGERSATSLSPPGHPSPALRAPSPLLRGGERAGVRGSGIAASMNQSNDGGELPQSPASPPGAASAILPLMIGDEARAVATAAVLREQGLFIPAIRYPTVARGAARLRITITAAHSAEDVAQLAGAMQALNLASFNPSTLQPFNR